MNIHTIFFFSQLSIFFFQLPLTSIPFSFFNTDHTKQWCFLSSFFAVHFWSQLSTTIFRTNTPNFTTWLITSHTALKKRKKKKANIRKPKFQTEPTLPIYHKVKIKQKEIVCKITSSCRHESSLMSNWTHTLGAI